MKFLVPNAVTASSMILGLASVVCAAQGQLELAAWMIVWGVLLDTVDGAAARLLDASSALGAQLDSFSDFVVFGVAPAALVYFGCASAGNPNLTVMVGASAFVVSTAIRLSRFNTAPPPYGPGFFKGIPSTSCGAFVALTHLVAGRQGVLEGWRFVAPLILGLTIVAMHSPIRLPKLRPGKNMLLNFFMGIGVVMAYTLGPLQMWPEALLGLEGVALIGGALWAGLHRSRILTGTPSQGLR
ncbi:MAG: CDP-alcohol phosphatidyltransferase family protein [Myxococcota bacterium]